MIISTKVINPSSSGEVYIKNQDSWWTVTEVTDNSVL